MYKKWVLISGCAVVAAVLVKAFLEVKNEGEREEI